MVQIWLTFLVSVLHGIFSVVSFVSWLLSLRGRQQHLRMDLRFEGRCQGINCCSCPDAEVCACRLNTKCNVIISMVCCHYVESRLCSSTCAWIS
jgi:hypothetical protein